MKRHHPLVLVTVTLTLVSLADVSMARERLPAPRAGGPATRADSAADELAVGRPWHAVRILTPALRDGTITDEERWLMAQGEAGYGSWRDARALLEGAAWIDRVAGAAGWDLLGRALEHGGDWPGAVGAYRSALALGPLGPDGAAVKARLVRALDRVGAVVESRALLDELAAERPVVASWLALELLEPAAGDGAVEVVRDLWRRVRTPEARAAGWSALPRAHARAEAPEAARVAIREALGWVEDPSDRARAFTMLGDLEQERGQRAAARAAWSEALVVAPRTGAALEAARALVAEPGLGAELGAVAASALARAGDSELAIRAYDLAFEGGALDEGGRVERARLLAHASTRAAEAATELEALSGSDDAGIAARALDQLGLLRANQGRMVEARELRSRLIEAHPRSAQAAEVQFLRGSSAEDAGRLDEAAEHYRGLVASGSSHSRAGEAAMRLGRMESRRGRRRAAIEAYDRYLEAFPRGRRWTEAVFWLGMTRVEGGDRDAGLADLARLAADEPVSYYGVMAHHVLERPFAIPVADRPEPPLPQWLRAGLEDLDALAGAGLDDALEPTMDALAARARTSPAHMLRLASELIARGHTIAGINLGWELRGSGLAWDRRLLEVVFPFPGRERVSREAGEYGIDPILMAALIRQESAWDVDIVSRAGAVGLMQVMPATGRELARRLGPADFEEESLRFADVNLHLGAAFLRDNLGRYPALPLTLSAYNAGPTRATRWSRYPESGDDLRFTERIPFAETQDYVKQVRRNQAIYGFLYGER